MNDFSEKDYRYKVMLPIELFVDIDKYKAEMKKQTLNYKKAEDFVYLVKNSLNRYPNMKSLIWSLESRGIRGYNFGVLSKEEFEEQVRILNMFLKLSYWN